MSIETLVGSTKNCVKSINVNERCSRATMWHEEDLSPHCKSCLIQKKFSEFYFRKMTG